MQEKVRLLRLQFSAKGIFLDRPNRFLSIVQLFERENETKITKASIGLAGASQQDVTV